jgi:hypothetical protein
VPTTSPVRVWLEESSARAMPKSVSLAIPSGVTMIFAGLTSRWMTPFSCAAASASAACPMIERVRAGPRAPLVAMSWLSGVPRTSSMTRYAVPASSP